MKDKLIHNIFQFVINTPEIIKGVGSGIYGNNYKYNTFHEQWIYDEFGNPNFNVDKWVRLCVSMDMPESVLYNISNVPDAYQREDYQALKHLKYEVNRTWDITDETIHKIIDELFFRTNLSLSEYDQEEYGQSRISFETIYQRWMVDRNIIDILHYLKGIYSEIYVDLFNQCAPNIILLEWSCILLEFIHIPSIRAPHIPHCELENLIQFLEMVS